MIKVTIVRTVIIVKIYIIFDIKICREATIRIYEHIESIYNPQHVSYHN